MPAAAAKKPALQLFGHLFGLLFGLLSGLLSELLSELFPKLFPELLDALGRLPHHRLVYGGLRIGATAAVPSLFGDGTDALLAELRPDNVRDKFGVCHQLILEIAPEGVAVEASGFKPGFLRRLIRGDARSDRKPVSDQFGNLAHLIPLLKCVT